MSAYGILLAVSNANDQAWTVETMLELACQYIDNQDSEDAFEDFLGEAAESDQGDEEKGDDLCDHCMRSGLAIYAVDGDGKTMCRACSDSYFGTTDYEGWEEVA